MLRLSVLLAAIALCSASSAKIDSYDILVGNVFAANSNIQVMYEHILQPEVDDDGDVDMEPEDGDADGSAPKLLAALKYLANAREGRHMLEHRLEALVVAGLTNQMYVPLWAFLMARAAWAPTRVDVALMASLFSALADKGAKLPLHPESKLDSDIVSAALEELGIPEADDALPKSSSNKVSIVHVITKFFTHTMWTWMRKTNSTVFDDVALAGSKAAYATANLKSIPKQYNNAVMAEKLRSTEFELDILFGAAIKSPDEGPSVDAKVSRDSLSTIDEEDEDDLNDDSDVNDGSRLDGRSKHKGSTVDSDGGDVDDGSRSKSGTSSDGAIDLSLKSKSDSAESSDNDSSVHYPNQPWYSKFINWKLPDSDDSEEEDVLFF